MTDLRTQLQSTFGDAYTIERELGGGGMSRVFVATEQALGRPVVVKVLPSETAGALSVERFRREVRLAASLQQANIVPVLSAGDAGGVAYYTMPFVKGESLRSHLAAKGALPIPQCVAILRDVARALAFAHAEGVVHRDIKPENILLSGGTAVVTDFGIAKAVAASSTQAGAPTLTQLGVALGTPAYMAPEQAVGDEVDHRADIYSLGVVGYEMLTGTAPFAGRSMQATLAAHAMEAPAPISAKRPEAPVGLIELVTRCLAKEQADRPQSATAVLTALDTMTTPQFVATKTHAKDDKPSIAVLPFANLSPDAADEYFADGLTDEIITDLSAIHALRVIARASMMRFKGFGKDPQAVARELNVRYALDGSVRRAGTSLRLTVRLTDTADGSVLWSDKLGGSVDDVFAVQEKVSRTIVESLRVTLTPREEQHLKARPIVDLQAYDCYLQARQLMWTFTVSALDRARNLIESAQGRIGENARLIATLGGIHINYIETGQVAAATHLARAQDCVDRLAILDPDSISLHALRGWLEWRRGEIREAIGSLTRARELDPNNAEVGIVLTYAYILAGQDARARETADAYLILDPLTPIFQCMPGFCEIAAGRPAKAVPHYRKFRELDPGNPAAYLFLIWAQCQAGELADARAGAEQLAVRFSGTALGALGAAYAAALRGDTTTGRSVLTPAMVGLSRHSESMGTLLANVLTLLGEYDAAIDVLENSVRLGLAHYPYLAREATVYAPLRALPRFQRLLGLVRERWERGGAAAEDHVRDPFASAPDVGVKPTIAVLPLTNMSPSADDEYFADGMTEDIIAQLSKVASLKVTSRTSVMRYKKPDLSMGDIAKALGASHVVEGTVRRAGSRLRIVAQLIEAASDAHLWAQTFDRELTDVFAVQTEVAEQIAAALRATLSSDERVRLEQRATRDIQAYNLYLLGRFHFGKHNIPDWRRSIEYFDQAIARDPTFAPAHAAAAEAWAWLVYLGGAPPREGFARARDAAQKAVALDATLGDAHVSLGLITAAFDWNWTSAEAQFRRALALNPNSVNAHLWYAAFVLTPTLRHDEAIAEMHKAAELDPVSLDVRCHLGMAYYFARRYEPAIVQFRQALDLDRNFSMARAGLGFTYTALGRFDEAYTEFRQAVADSAVTSDAVLAYAYALGGRQGEARAMLHSLEERARHQYVIPMDFSLLYTGLGEKDKAFGWLRKASEERLPLLVAWITSVCHDPLREDPRFTALVHDLGLNAQATT